MKKKKVGIIVATYDYCHGITYTVKQGDTLYSISRRYNVPLALILRANPYVDIYNLQVDDEICIPYEWPGEDGDMESMPPGMPPSMFPGMPPGMSPGMPPSMSPGMPPSMSPGMPPSMSPGMPPSMSPGMPPSMSPGMPPNMSPGMPPSMSPNMSPNMPSRASDGMVPNENLTPMSPSMNTESETIVAYVVKDTDTIKKILDYFDISLEDLLKYNGLDAIMLKPGMTIKVPKSTDD